MRIVDVFVFTAIWVRFNNTHALGHCVIFSDNKVTPPPKAEGARTPMRFQNPFKQEYIIECKHVAWLETWKTKQTKNCLQSLGSFLVTDYPSQHLRVFLVKRVSFQKKVLSLFERRKFTSLNRARNLLQNERTTVLPLSRPFTNIQISFRIFRSFQDI